MVVGQLNDPFLLQKWPQQIYQTLLDPQGGQRMILPGFDDEFVDFPDYIIRITDRIWHDRDVELCARYYTDDCLIHTMTGNIIGRPDCNK
jgi:hypothetical protein